MMQLLFTVRAATVPPEKMKVVGSIKELGLWNIQNALQLNFRNNLWQGAISINQNDVKIEFKLINIKLNGQIEWQQLPKNANRRYRPKVSTQFHLEWSKSAGKVNSISRFSYKLKGLPVVGINNGKQDHHDKNKKPKEFDPYAYAQNNDDSGESDQEQFLLVKRKMFDQISINSTDLEEIYYKNSAVEILAGLLKKIKVYVITQELEQTHPLHTYVEEELCKVPQHYLPRWITEQCFSHQNFSGKLKKAGSIFQIGKQQMMLQSLYSRTSYFILLEIQVGLSLGSQLEKVSCCLFLPSEKYQEVILHFNKLIYIDLICFDSIQTNKQFCQYLKTRNSQTEGEQGQNLAQFKQKPSIQLIVQQLQKRRQRTVVIPTSISNVNQNECLAHLTKPNTLSIIDYSIIAQHPLLAQKIFKNMGPQSMYLIISESKMPRLSLQFKQQKNVVLVYNNFQKIFIEGKEYLPIRSFRESIDQIKLKSKIFKESIGGEITEKENSLIYVVPEGRNQTALKLELECKSFVKKFSFAKVSRKGLRVKVSWNLSKEIRMLRSICQIKLMNQGQLGDFNLLSTQNNLKDIREDLKLLVEHEPKFFNSKIDPKIRYYSYNGSKTYLSLVPQNASPN